MGSCFRSFASPYQPLFLIPVLKECGRDEPVGSATRGGRTKSLSRLRPTHSETDVGFVEGAIARGTV